MMVIKDCNLEYSTKEGSVFFWRAGLKEVRHNPKVIYSIKRLEIEFSKREKSTRRKVWLRGVKIKKSVFRVLAEMYHTATWRCEDKLSGMLVFTLQESSRLHICIWKLAAKRWYLKPGNWMRLAYSEPWQGSEKFADRDCGPKS